MYYNIQIHEDMMEQKIHNIFLYYQERPHMIICVDRDYFVGKIDKSFPLYHQECKLRDMKNIENYILVYDRHIKDFFYYSRYHICIYHDTACSIFSDNRVFEYMSKNSRLFDDILPVAEDTHNAFEEGRSNWSNGNSLIYINNDNIHPYYKYYIIEEYTTIITSDAIEMPSIKYNDVLLSHSDRILEIYENNKDGYIDQLFLWNDMEPLKNKTVEEKMEYLLYQHYNFYNEFLNPPDNITILYRLLKE